MDRSTSTETAPLVVSESESMQPKHGSIFDSGSWTSLQSKMATPKRRPKRKAESAAQPGEITWGNVPREAGQTLLEGRKVSDKECGISPSPQVERRVDLSDQTHAKANMFGITTPIQASASAPEPPHLETSSPTDINQSPHIQPATIVDGETAAKPTLPEPTPASIAKQPSEEISHSTTQPLRNTEPPPQQLERAAQETPASAPEPPHLETSSPTDINQSPHIQPATIGDGETAAAKPTLPEPTPASIAKQPSEEISHSTTQPPRNNEPPPQQLERSVQETPASAPEPPHLETFSPTDINHLPSIQPATIGDGETAAKPPLPEPTTNTAVQPPAKAAVADSHGAGTGGHTEADLISQIRKQVLESLLNEIKSGAPLSEGLAAVLGQSVSGPTSVNAKQEPQTNVKQEPSHRTGVRKLPVPSEVIDLDSPESKPAQNGKTIKTQQPTIKQEQRQQSAPSKRKHEEQRPVATPQRKNLNQMWRKHAAQSATRRHTLTRKAPSWSKRGNSPEPTAKDLSLASDILDEMACSERPTKKMKQATEQPADEAVQAILNDSNVDEVMGHTDDNVPCLLVRESQGYDIRAKQMMLQTYAIASKNLPLTLYLIANIGNGMKSVCVGTCNLS